MFNGPSAPNGIENSLDAAASVHAVDDLRGRGIRRVRVLDPSRMAEIARIAVNRALRAQVQDVALVDDDRRRLEAAAMAEFQRLVDLGLERTEDRHTSADELRALMSQEGRRIRRLVDFDECSEPAHSGAGLTSADLATIEKRMVEDLGELIERDWRAELQLVRDSHQRQLSVMEQRIAKLVGALESTERVIDELQSARGHDDGTPDTIDIDDGAGLDSSGPLFQKKTQLLNALFQANVKMRELEGDGGGSSVAMG